MLIRTIIIACAVAYIPGVNTAQTKQYNWVENWMHLEDIGNLLLINATKLQNTYLCNM